MNHPLSSPYNFNDDLRKEEQPKSSKRYQNLAESSISEVFHIFWPLLYLNNQN